MRDRGKGIDAFSGGDPCFMDNFSTPMEFPCKKHPSSYSSSSSSGGGICAFCLRDKLARLVCPQCGEQRLPNCSCSVSPAPKSGVDPGFLRRSSSTRVPDVNPGGGFRKIRNLFRKKKEKIELGGGQFGTEIGVPRSTSLRSFRGGGGVGSGGGGGSGFSFYDAEDSGLIHSAARASSVSGGFVMESAKRSCFSESEARMSNFEGRISNFDYERDMMGKGIYPMREGYEFYNVEDPKFIDLKLDLSSSSSSEIRRSGLMPPTREGYGEEDWYGGGGFNGGGSCRLSVSENELKKCRKSRKGWRWLFKASSDLGKEKD